MDYDILVLGGGIIGCAVVYELSKYNLNIALIEKEYDIASDMSFVNSAIVYDGSETANSIMASLEYIGNSILENLCQKFDVPFKRVGGLRVVSDDNGVEKLYEMYNRSKKIGIDGLELISKDEILKFEPNINEDIKCGLYSKNLALVAPYDLAIGYAEVAFDNGVNFRLEEEVLKIKKINKGLSVVTNKNKFKCRLVVNTIGNNISILEDGKVMGKEDNIIENEFKNMTYILIDNNSKNTIKNIITKTFDKDTFVVSSPIVEGGTIIGIKSSEKTTLQDNISYVKKLVKDIKQSDINNLFRETYDKDEIYIDESDIDNGYISVRGTHYGKITLAPAISNMLCDSITSNFKCSQKRDFIDKRRESYKFRNMTDDEINEVINLDSKYGKIICTCNNVSEGEIVDSIRRPLGARTVKAVKRRTGAGLSSCYGSYCNEKIIKILSRELDKNISDIVEDSKNSNIVSKRIKEFNEI